ncbi:MAG: GNAT family N-acetyltransferase [Microbacteriaceae bacterium]
MSELRLQELTAQTIAAANSLTLKPGQEAFVAPTTYTHYEDQLDPTTGWPRVVLDGDEVVGYIMGNFDPEASEDFARSALWRVNVSADAQGQGVGRFAVLALAEEARSRGFETLTVVWEPGEAGPEEFFKAVGFEIVDETIYGDRLGRLSL